MVENSFLFWYWSPTQSCRSFANTNQAKHLLHWDVQQPAILLIKISNKAHAAVRQNIQPQPALHVGKQSSIRHSSLSQCHRPASLMTVWSAVSSDALQIRIRGVLSPTELQFRKIFHRRHKLSSGLPTQPASTCRCVYFDSGLHVSACN